MLLNLQFSSLQDTLNEDEAFGKTERDLNQIMTTHGLDLESYILIIGPSLHPSLVCENWSS